MNFLRLYTVGWKKNCKEQLFNISISELVDLEYHPEKVMQWLKDGLAEIDGETYFPEEYEPNQPIIDYFS